MTTAHAVSKEHIEITPGTCGGRPRIAGTRISVDFIARLYFEGGQSPEEIVDGYPHLERADIYAALAYYLDHKDEIDRRRAEDDAFIDEMVREGRFREVYVVGPDDGPAAAP